MILRRPGQIGSLRKREYLQTNGPEYVFVVFCIPMKKIVFGLCLTLSQILYAQGPALDLAELNLKDQLLIQELSQKLPESFVTRLSSTIKIKSQRQILLNRKNKRVALYNDFTKTISIAPEVFENRTLLQKTFYHELAHAYEMNGEKVHKIAEFQITAGLHKRGIFPKFLKQRNFLESASADAYEHKNVYEVFPVNFEYFMTDPDFQCRKPLLNSFFSRYFNYSPFEKKACQMVNKVPVSINNLLNYVPMDFSQLYEVHYLFASKGEEAMSRFGHSMIRLVFCAPNKTQKDQSCLKDIAHHWVISFRANVQDIEINNIKGMMGKYPSEIFIFPMVEIIREYTKVELRDLISLPLNLNEEQMERFRLNVLETSYAYQGRYRFFTVNCATETLNFLQAVMNEDELYEKHSITPIWLYKKLKKMNLSRPEVLADEETAVKEGYIFKAKEDVLNKSFEKIQALTGKKDLKQYLVKTSPLQRRGYFEKAELSSMEWASVLLIEKHIFEKAQKEYMENVAQLVVDSLDKKEIPEAVKYLETLRHNVIENNSIRYDWNGYGIPFEKDFVEPALLPVNVTKEDGVKAQAWIEKNFPEEKAQLDLITENVAKFARAMKDSIGRSK